MQLVVKLTKYIVETYQACNPTFTYSISFNPKRYLTIPSKGVSNDGQDNVNSDLILYVNGVLINGDDNRRIRRYTVSSMLGQGTFGQVCKCWTDDGNGVAVKVIKNQPAYFHQALVEISICHMLNHQFDPRDGHNIVRILDHFVFEGHLCLVFELLNANLLELLKLNHFKGLSMMLVRRFTKQMLEALTVLRDASVIHCDLKPENILLKQSLESAEIKLIDFGSACTEHRTVYSYIQSRFYRSPEVILGHQYTTAIDMWSLGCVAAELFLGLPLFPGASEYDVLQRMIETLGSQPPDNILRQAKNTFKFFKLTSSAPVGREGQTSGYHFLNETEFEARELKRPQLGRRYFTHKKLEDIIVTYPLRKKMNEAETSAETQARIAFIDFLKGLLHFDPLRRWTPRQAVQHPFLTEEPYLRPFSPPPAAPRTPVAHGMAMDHNPVTGHWFGAGLSPQVNVPGIGRNYNPQFHSAPFSYASSYGSIGSYGSYGDGAGLGSSFGSYGDTAGVYASFPTTPVTGVNGHNPGGAAGAVLAASPETYRRMHMPNISAQLGMSPSSGFRPLSLGASPSHNFPLSPGSNFHASPGSNYHPSPISYAASPTSTYHGSPAPHFLASPCSPSHGSPGRYGPTSPARAGANALGKIAHYNNHNNMNRRMHWEKMPPHTPNHHDFMAAHRNRIIPNGNDSALRGTGSQGLHNAPWRQRNGSMVTHPPSSSNSYPHGSLGALLNSAEYISEGGEDVSPPPEDPGNWDPSYSDDLLLGVDSFEAPSSGVTAMDLSEVSNGVSRLGTGTFSGPGQGPGSGPALVGYQQGHSGLSNSQPRPNGTVPGHLGMAGNVEGNGVMQHTALGQQWAYSRNAPKHETLAHAQNTSPSRLGQLPHHQQQQQQRSQLQPQHHVSLQQPSEVSSSTGFARGSMGKRPGPSSVVGKPPPPTVLSNPPTALGKSHGGKRTA